MCVGCAFVCCFEFGLFGLRVVVCGMLMFVVVCVCVLVYVCVMACV